MAEEEGKKIEIYREAIKKEDRVHKRKEMVKQWKNLNMNMEQNKYKF